jgi:hypothetical protein
MLSLYGFLTPNRLKLPEQLKSFIESAVDHSYDFFKTSNEEENPEEWNNLNEIVKLTKIIHLILESIEADLILFAPEFPKYRHLKKLLKFLLEMFQL